MTRWRRGDIRSVVRSMGMPSADMTREAGKALLDARSAEDWDALSAFQSEVWAEVEHLMPLYSRRRLLLSANGELFAALAFAAAEALKWEIVAYMGVSPLSALNDRDQLS